MESMLENEQDKRPSACDVLQILQDHECIDPLEELTSSSSGAAIHVTPTALVKSVRKDGKIVKHLFFDNLFVEIKLKKVCLNDCNV